ncbi:MAG: hypothetical protein H6726_13530 [Sandaracinaceae bacterium]|nr:hypothetical protein [Sandaracinaceae bacterium]
MRSSTPVLKWRFACGGGGSSLIDFLHLQLEKHKLDHQGKQYAAIFFDELTHFTRGQFWYLVSRLYSTCGVRPFLRATCNPDPDSFVRKLIDWWPRGLVIPSAPGSCGGSTNEPLRDAFFLEATASPTGSRRPHRRGLERDARADRAVQAPARAGGVEERSGLAPALRRELVPPA